MGVSPMGLAGDSNLATVDGAPRDASGLYRRPATRQPAPAFAHGIPLVDIRVGDAPGWAMVDTGSPYTYVDTDLRDALAGPQDPHSKTGPAKSAAAKLWIGTSLWVKQTVRFLDLESFDASTAKHPLIAILGRDVLGTYAFGIDVKRGRMKLWKGGRVSPEAIEKWASGRERGGIALEMQLEHPPAAWNGSVLTLDLGVDRESGAWTLSCTLGANGPTLPLHFDTGSSFTSVHWSELSALGLKPLRTETAADVFGAMAHPVVALPELHVGGLIAKDLELYVEEEDVRPDLLAPKDLGVAWYVVDPPAGKLYLAGR
jgi:hypothetical protein